MSNYETWTKPQLIAHIHELQKMQSSGATKSQIAPQRGGQIAPQNIVQNPPQNIVQNPPQKTKRKFNFDHHHTRFIGIRFAYLGWNYNGLSFQYEPTPLPTVEEEIVSALAKAKLIRAADPAVCNFSRCGRTDKGVSAMNQVISLDVRSQLSPEEQQDKSNDGREVPYMTILNSLLPTDIRVTAVSLRPPPDFNARFSCSYRHYKYIISDKNVDMELVKLAANKYKGVHDFRNFCKLDGSKQITNYHREVYDAQLIPLKDGFWTFDLKGSAFLWHQVRCMVAVMLAVGQKLEPVTIVDDLLDVEKNPRKPNYDMAHDVPLILYDCIFPEMEWLTAKDFEGHHKNIREYAKVRGLVADHKVKGFISEIMAQHVIRDEELLPPSQTINLGDGMGRAYKQYRPILERDLGDHFETVNERHREKRRKSEKK